MSKRIIASFTLASYMVLSAPVWAIPAASGGTPVAKIETATGKLSGLSSGKEWSPSVGGSVVDGTVLRAGADGQAVVVFPSGDRIRLAPGTELTIVSVKGSEVQLHQGRLLGSVSSGLKVRTSSGLAVGSEGEFVVEAGAEGAGLKVLSGSAVLSSAVDQPTSYASVSMFPGGFGVDEILKLGGLAYEQSLGQFVFGGGKGLRVRSTNDNESVGGLEDASPDQDIPAPPRRTPPRVYQPVETPPPFVETPPPVIETPPPVVESPPPVIVEQPVAVAPSGGGSAGGAVLGGLGLAAGLAGLIVALNNDDDFDNNDNFAFVGGGGGGTPSPAQP